MLTETVDLVVPVVGAALAGTTVPAHNNKPATIAATFFIGYSKLDNSRILRASEAKLRAVSRCLVCAGTRLF